MQTDLHHGLPSRRSRAIVEKLPLLGMALCTGVATVVIQKRAGAVAGLETLPVSRRAATAAVEYVEYLWKTVWPTHLAAFYPLHTHPIWLVLAAALGLTLATAAAIRYRDRYPYVLVGWLWYIVTLAPVVGLVQAGEQRMADRFMYIPLIGLLVIVAWGVPEIVRRSQGVVRAAAVSIVLLSAATARAQVAHWSDSVSLWQHATEVTPDSYIAYENLGQALRELGQFEQARASYLQALAQAPPNSPVYVAAIENSLGMVMTRQGNPGEALPHFAEAVRLNPGFGEAQSNMGNALAAAGRIREAIEHYQAAVRIKPDFSEALVGLGGALLGDGKAVDAMPYYRQALRLDPDLAEAHNGLGAGLAMQGHDDEALAEYGEALRLKPGLATAHFNVAMLLIKQGKIDEAERRLEWSLSIDPAYRPAQQMLGILRSK